jgi:hypothetical protein
LTSVTSKLCAIGCHIQQTSSNGLKVGWSFPCFLFTIHLFDHFP